jgi:D-sedoheptulose 7-phosphate isomerase
MNISNKNLSQSYLLTLERHRAAFASVEQYQDQAMQWLYKVQQCISQGGKVVWMGNGGSAADAQHLAAEFMVRYRQERAPLASMALTTDSSILTAHSNDYEFSTVFERQVQGIVKPQDVVVGLTTSGNSANINFGLQAANALGAYTVALTGRDGGKVACIAKLPIIVRNDETARIQEVHMFLGHWLCEALDLVYATAATQ